MKFTSRDLSLKRTPSKKQSGVFGVKINVVTKYDNCPGFLDQKQKGHRSFGVPKYLDSLIGRSFQTVNCKEKCQA